MRDLVDEIRNNSRRFAAGRVCEENPEIVDSSEFKRQVAADLKSEPQALPDHFLTPA